MKKIIPIPNGFFRLSVKALVLNEDNKFLLERESNGKWDIPGGGMEFGESFDEALKRELREENGLEVREMPAQPELVTLFINASGQWTCNLIFKVKLKNLDYTPTDECREIGFFDKELTSRIPVYPSVKAFCKVFN